VGLSATTDILGVMENQGKSVMLASLDFQDAWVSRTEFCLHMISTVFIRDRMDLILVCVFFYEKTVILILGPKGYKGKPGMPGLSGRPGPRGFVGK